MSTQDCIFCKIIRGEVPSEALYRDDRCMVIRDIRPAAPVHLLIIPLAHLAGLAYVGAGQVPVMGHLFEVAEEMARREGVTLSGYRLVVNQGPDSGQEIPHVHMHLLAGRPLPPLG